MVEDGRQALAGFNQASQAVITPLELDQVLAEIVSLPSGVMASDHASVVLVDEEGRLGQSACQALREHVWVRALELLKVKGRSSTEPVYKLVRLMG